MFLFWALKDQSGELQRLSNEAPSRLGVWIVSLCRFIGFRRWTHQIFHKIDTCSKKDFNRLNQNFSSKTFFFLGPDWYRQKFSWRVDFPLFCSAGPSRTQGIGTAVRHVRCRGVFKDWGFRSHFLRKRIPKLASLFSLIAKVLQHILFHVWVDNLVVRSWMLLYNA